MVNLCGRGESLADAGAGLPPERAEKVGADLAGEEPTN
jgi:hypothetical protein